MSVGISDGESSIVDNLEHLLLISFVNALVKFSLDVLLAIALIVWIVACIHLSNLLLHKLSQSILLTLLLLQKLRKTLGRPPRLILAGSMLRCGLVHFGHSSKHTMLAMSSKATIRIRFTYLTG